MIRLFKGLKWSVLAVGRPKGFNEERVLNLAMKLFWKQGYDTTSMQQLVDTLGINRFSLYDSFGGKKQLFIRTLHHYRSHVLARLLGPLANSERLNPRSKVLDYLALMKQELLAPTGRLGCMIQRSVYSSLVDDTEVRCVIQSMYQDIRLALESVISEGQTSGEFGLSQGATTRAEHLLVCLQEVLVVSQMHDDKAFLENQFSLLESQVAAW